MAKQKIQLSDHFNYSRLLRFVLPCIGTMLFTSIYGVVDGLCVSNFVGKTAFAAVNLIMPLPMLIGTVGFMLGTGGSAIVGITLGEGDEDKANRYFSLFVLTAFFAGVALSVLGLFILRPVAILMGAKGEMLDFAVRYYFTEHVPEFLCHGGKTDTGVLVHGGCRLHQHGAGRRAGGLAPLGRGGRGHCNVHQPDRGRRAAGVLFPEP